MNSWVLLSESKVKGLLDRHPIVSTYLLPPPLVDEESEF